MNVQGIARAAIGVINPDIKAKLLRSDGYATDPEGNRSPAYSNPIGITVQRQQVTQADLRHIDGLNIQGLLAVFYSTAQINGVERSASGVTKGGDMIVLCDGSKWLCLAVTESWPEWCRVIGVRQL